MDRQQIEALRLQVLANGYSPIRNMDKRTFMPSWPSVVIDEAEIKSWTRRFSRHAATGLRVENGLCVIDFDVDDRAAMDCVLDAVIAAHPELGGDNVLVRWGKGAKEAWFLRCDTLFTRLHTRAYIHPNETADDATHRVEIFGGGSPRQFGAFGPHTLDEDTGEVKIRYEWADDMSPENVRLDELLEVGKAVLWDVIDIAERTLESLGWQIFERSKKGESATGKVYDLVPEMVFECNDDIDRTLDELRAILTDEDAHMRCSASWLEGPTAKNRTRCLISKGRDGGVVIWESMEGVSHHEASAAPIDYGHMIDRVAEKLTELKERRHTKLNPGDDYRAAFNKLLRGYAYCSTQKNSIVPLYATGLDEGYQLQSFRLLMLPFAEKKEGPKGGVKTINPVDMWLSVPERIAVEGLRMRPDKERPLYQDGGKQYLNVYSPPSHHEEGGSAATGLRFLAHLVPDAEERDWFCKWLAFQPRHPHIPRPAVVMVAHDTFGTGRGTMAELMARLFGRQYVRQLPFNTFTGKTYQSQYNDWQSEALFVCVNESAESDSGSSYQTKVNTYEHLKDIVEVRSTEREIKRKGDRNYWAWSCTTFLIATNHMDALPIPEHDRRFCVITNGSAKPQWFWDEINAWMEKPENVAALFNWFMDYDVAGYSPYAKPPTFSAKANMIDEAKSDLDRAIDHALVNLPGEVFTLQQLAKYVKLVADKDGMELPRPFDSVFRKVCRRRLSRIGVRGGKNWNPQLEGHRYSVYARGHGTASTWSDAEPDEIQAEIVKNGSADGSGSNVLSGLFRRHETPEK